MKYIIGLVLIFTVGIINAQKMDTLKRYIFNEYADQIGETFRLEDKNKIFFKSKLVLDQINYYRYDTDGNVRYDSLINSKYDGNGEYFGYSLSFYNKRTNELYIIKPLVDLHYFFIGNNSNLPKLELILNENGELEFISK